MQCVILAAGRGSRMGELTFDTPKPLLKVGGKTILDHIGEALPLQITEVIIVVGYLGEQIRNHYGEIFHGRPVRYVYQENPKGGTGDALLHVRGLITGKFLMMYADDLHGGEALAKVVDEEHAMLVAAVKNPKEFGIVEYDDTHHLIRIVEKPEHPKGNLANVGGWVVTPEIFEYEVPLGTNGEIDATDMLTAYANDDRQVRVVEQKGWIPVGTPEQLREAERLIETNPFLVAA